MTTTPPDGTATPDRPEAGEPPVDFETAQQRLFEAYGVQPRSQFVDLEQPPVRTHVIETGPETSEPPVVCVHGTAAFGAFFAPLLGHFEGLRLIAFDRPGYGRSDPFTYTESNLRDTVLDTLAGVLDGLGLDRVDLLGHSMGGYTAMLFAGAHPERVRHLLVLGSVPTFPGTSPPLPFRLLSVPGLGRLLTRVQKSGEAGVLDVAEIFGEREAITAHPAFVQAIAAHERDPLRAAAGVSEFRALISPLGWRSSVRLTPPELRSIRAPTSVVWGTHDTLGEPAAVREGVDLLPTVRFETVDAGHIPFLAHGERCAAIVREASDQASPTA